MVSKQSMPSTDFMKNIEEAIKEYGTMACPNPRCYDKLVSKKKWNRNHGKVLEYHCQNANCAYHTKRQIPLEDEATLATSSSAKMSHNNILTIFGVLLFGILTYTSYQIYTVNQFLENEVAENRIERSSSARATYSHNLDASKINRKPLLKSKGIAANNPIEETLNINGFAGQTRAWVATGNFEQAILNIRKILTDRKYQSTLLLPENDLTRFQMIELVGDSYDKMGTQFSNHLLKQMSDFEMMKKFMEVFDVEERYSDVFLGKAYLRLPNKLEKKVNLQERKKMQLISLKYYLLAAKSNNFVGQKSSSIKAINELAKAYQLFKYNPKKPKKHTSIETLIKRNNQAEIQNRIDYIDIIIARLS
jgi:hypothetical protein